MYPLYFFTILICFAVIDGGAYAAASDRVAALPWPLQLIGAPPLLLGAYLFGQKMDELIRRWRPRRIAASGGSRIKEFMSRLQRVPGAEFDPSPERTRHIAVLLRWMLYTATFLALSIITRLLMDTMDISVASMSTLRFDCLFFLVALAMIFVASTLTRYERREWFSEKRSREPI